MALSFLCREYRVTVTHHVQQNDSAQEQTEYIGSEVKKCPDTVECVFLLLGRETDFLSRGDVKLNCHVRVRASPVLSSFPQEGTVVSYLF